MARLVRSEDLKTDFSPGRRTKPLEGSSITQLIDIFKDLRLCKVGQQRVSALTADPFLVVHLPGG